MQPPVPQRTFRTQVIDVLRGCLKWEFPERALAALINGRERSFWLWKLVPPRYLYRRPAIRRVTRAGIRFELDISNYNDYFLFYGLIDAGLQELYTSLQPEGVVLDIGANLGFTSLNFAQHCRQGHVYAFEPDPGSYQKLITNQLLNNFPSLTVFNKALGESIGIAQLVSVVAQHSGMNRLQNESTAAAMGKEVNVSRVDDEVKELGLQRLDLIKVDVEGYEWHVLQGARETIRQFKPALFLELIDQNLRPYGHSAREVVDLLQQWNYKVTDVKTGKILSPTDQLNTDIYCLPLTS